MDNLWYLPVTQRNPPLQTCGLTSPCTLLQPHTLPMNAYSAHPPYLTITTSQTHPIYIHNPFPTSPFNAQTHSLQLTNFMHCFKINGFPLPIPCSNPLPTSFIDFNDESLENGCSPSNSPLQMKSSEIISFG